MSYMYPYNPAITRTLEFAAMFYEAVDTDRACALAGALRDGVYSEIVDASVDPHDYRITSDFRDDYAVVNLLRKLDGLPLDVDTHAVALRSFKATENQCASTNIRWMSARPFPNGLESLIVRIQEKIVSIIGDVPDYEVVASLMRWGPGATATIKGDDVRIENKYLEPKLSVAPRSLRLAQRLVGSNLHWARARIGPDVEGPCSLVESEFRLVPYMRVTTVNKDSSTKRTIGIEPTMNTWIQQGIGRTWKRKLYKYGINLRDQTWNQTLARVAGMLGLCTLDVKNASNSVAYWPVVDLFPPAWVQLLLAARSESALLDGKLVPLEMFSSMGNGYTFELETILFYSICASVCDEQGISSEYLSVYGDDIIVDRKAHKRILEVFRMFGFTINSRKSYVSGRFFESCGVHAFNGVDVTPIYQKELLHELPQLVRAHNRILRWCERTRCCPSRFDRLLRWLRKEGQKEVEILRSQGEKARLPRIPYGSDGDSGYWTKQLLVQWMDGKALLDVLEVVSNEAPSVSDDSLYAEQLRRTCSDALRSDAQDDAEGGSKYRDLQPVVALRKHLAFDGFVTLRGDPEYRIRRRWVEYKGTPVWVSQLSPTRFLVVDDWLTIRALIPQLRGEARL